MSFLHHSRPRGRLPAVIGVTLLFLGPLVGPVRAAAQYYAITPDSLPSDLGEAVLHGTGPDTLLIIPCAACRWRSFDEFMARNADRFTMLAVTLPGYGGTAVPDLPMWTDSTLWRDAAIAALADAMERAGIARATVVGASYGSTVAVEFAAAHPERVSGVVNLDGGLNNPIGQDSLPMARRLENAAQVIGQFGMPLLDADRFQPFNTPGIYHRPLRRLLYHGWFMATDPFAMMQYWRENLLADGNRALESLRIPVLDVRALRPWDEDPEATRRGITAAMDSIATGLGYQLVFLYDTPHFVMEDRPQVLDSLVAAFVAARPISDWRPAGGGLVDLAPAAAREDFARGVAALHDFWYEEARDRFRIVQALAPTFTLGYWGEALALHQNPFGHREPPVDSMRAVLARLAPTPLSRSRRVRTGHERAYLAALEGLIAEEGTAAERHPAYADAMAALAAAHPDDVEASAFAARASLLRAPTFGAAPDVQAAVAAHARRVLSVDPDHRGGLHYLIHALDNPSPPAEVRAAADRYRAIARGASHAVHMPSHIYLQLGAWDDVIASNEAAVATSRANLERAGRPNEEIDVHAIHAWDFLHYALLQQGRYAEATAVVEEIRRLADASDRGTLRWFDALLSARQAMEMAAFPGLAEVESLPRSGYGSRGEFFAGGLAAALRGDAAEGRRMLDTLRARAPEETSPSWQVSALSLEAGVAIARADDAEAEALLRHAIARQADLSRPNETPSPEKPPEELLGELLLRLNRPAEAEEAFLAGHARWPNRLATVLGLARAAVARGDDGLARTWYEAVADLLVGADPGHPALAEARAVLD